ncbi:sigma-70 family RNA polymerase sigma factor [Micromonospora sp. NPDC049081]|uniref:sigma-70 family RNA polymerase sigma factor n=1 Tax=Micromonospora sp. NPDC049081 TaxID=3155150 RepID=UPI0033C9DBF3
MTNVHPFPSDVAKFVMAIRTDLGMTQAAFGAMTGRSVQSIRQYEHGLRRPPAIFFHDLIEAAPECRLRFNDIAITFSYRPIDSSDPARYTSIHDFFTGIRVLNGRSRAGFAAILSVSAPHIAAVEHGAKPEPDIVQRLALRFLRPTYRYADVVRRFRTLRPSTLDLRLRRRFQQLRSPQTDEKQRGQLRADLIRDNADLARQLAKREARRLTQPGDAAEAWTIALVKAVDGHDPLRGDFVPYLRKRIFGEVQQQAGCEWQSGTAKALRGMATRVCRARDDLRQQLRREPTPTEIARHLAMPVSAITDALTALSVRRAQPLDNDIAAPAPRTATMSFSTTMRQRLELLDEHLRAAIELRFRHGLDLAEIADRIGGDAHTVDSMLKAALLQLRELHPLGPHGHRPLRPALS